jgi:PAS domain S-box-containing protein
MDVLMALLPPAFHVDLNLWCLVLLRMANLSAEHGNCDGSCYAYGCMNTVVGGRFGNYRAGVRFGQLGLDLVEKKGLDRFTVRVYFACACAAIPWGQHVRAGAALLRRGLKAALETGDQAHAVYAHHNLVSNRLTSADPLAEVQREAESALEFAQKTRFRLMVDVVAAQLGFIRTVRGLTPEFGSFGDDGFDEGRLEQHLEASPPFFACQYWIRKLQARLYAGDRAQAVAAAAKARPLLQAVSGLFEEVDYHFYAALARAAASDSATADERREHSEALAEHHQRLALWAEDCAENFANRAALVGAEIARLDGRELEAERLYEQAIRCAREQGFVQNEGLAYELAARFHAARGFDAFADLYLRRARHCYQRWGADGKVRQLTELYPRLRENEPALDSRGTSGAPVEQLELATVLKVSQAVSGEMILDRLLGRLMRAAIEHAGAERGLLIARLGDELQIQAQATASGAEVTVSLRDSDHTEVALPQSLVRYVIRTQETVILEDAASQNLFSADPYLVRHRARSILCLPLINQGNLIGVLYLENNLAPRVFGPARIAVLKLLASQAAMSLENTRLYRDLAKREAQIRRLVDANIVGIFIWDIDGTILEANDALLRMVGYEREDLSSGRLRWTDLTPAQRLGSDRQEIVAEVQRTGSVQPYEWEYLRKDGSRVPVLVGGASFEGENQGVAFVLDLTERERAEAAQTRAQAELQQARNALAHRQRVSLLGEVAASLAHEIKQPIAAARIDAKVCLRALADDRLNLETAREAASRLVKEATMAGEIIQRTTALYKKDTTHRERVDVNAVIREMAVLLQQEARAASISIRTTLAEALPDVMADRVQLQQVFMNLMLNAIDAMKDTGGELTITSQPGEGAELRISVSDTGVGLPTENPDQIFDSFVTTKPHGTGMGLAITRSIVESHGGRLWAIANTGPGATFLFTLLREAGDPSRL